MVVLPHAHHHARSLQRVLTIGVGALLLLVAGLLSASGRGASASPNTTLPALNDGAAFAEQALNAGFIRSLDTMKESLDLQRGRQLSDEEIAHSVGLAASLNAEYVAVATSWEYPAYLERWVRAIRAAGLHVWFRGQPEHWVDPGGNRPMTPAEYLDALTVFVRGNGHLFADGDIFDPGAEPENGAYWAATWGPRWAWDPASPNEATRAFNSFIRESQMLARTLLRETGHEGVITSVRSINGWWATHPGALEHETVAVLGAITVDSYPDGDTADPAEAARLRLDELDQIWRAWGRPVIIGELGYPLRAVVSDEVQKQALAAMLNSVADRPFITGMNYWVGAPNTNPNDYRTAIFEGQRGALRPKPAAAELARLYARPPLRDPLALAPVPWRTGQNLLEDSGFEQDGIWFRDAALARIQDAAASGDVGIRLPGAGTWSNLAQEVTLLPDRCYEASVLVRGSGGARLDILDPNWQPLDVAVLPGPTEWRRITVPFASRGSRTVIVALRDSGDGGPTDIDDLEVRRCPGPAIE